jgi:hypothetical protein
MPLKVVAADLRVVPADGLALGRLDLAEDTAAAIEEADALGGSG